MTVEEVFWGQYPDEWGPAKIVSLYEPSSGLKGVVVVDNTALGPAIGGVRMADDLTFEEVFRLARTMTWKNAAAGLPHGGAKAGIRLDPAVAGEHKEAVIRAFARTIADLTEYIPGPDMGTDETCMAFIYDENGRSTGRPKVMGGIPLDELGSTGFGLTVAAEVLADFLQMDLKGARLAVQGFGNVGKAAARFLAERGVRLVAASDTAGAIQLEAGLEVERLIDIKQRGGKVLDYPGARPLAPEDLFALPVDILLPAARPDVITRENASRVRARMILQGANIPVTPEAETSLQNRGVWNLPDFIVNAGGVITTAVEIRHGSATQAFETIAIKIRENVRAVLDLVRDQGLHPREAAFLLAQQRVREGDGYRRKFRD